MPAGFSRESSAGCSDELHPAAAGGHARVDERGGGLALRDARDVLLHALRVVLVEEGGQRVARDAVVGVAGELHEGGIGEGDHAPRVGDRHGDAQRLDDPPEILGGHGGGRGRRQRAGPPPAARPMTPRR